MRQYFAGKNGQQLGPFTETEIRAKAASGELSATDLVWCEGMANWEPLGRVFAPGDSSNPYQPSAAVMDSSYTGTAGFDNTRLADRGTRLGASILDGLVALPLAIPFLLTMDRETGEPTTIGLVITGVLALALGIWNLVWLSTRGQTIAKRILGIKIVRFEDGGNPGFVKAVLLRSVVLGLVGIIPILNIIVPLVDALMIFRDDRRCLHDLIAGTKVVNVNKSVV